MKKSKEHAPCPTTKGTAEAVMPHYRFQLLNKGTTNMLSRSIVKLELSPF
jgi:hypothetical protein